MYGGWNQVLKDNWFSIMGKEDLEVSNIIIWMYPNSISSLGNHLTSSHAIIYTNPWNDREYYCIICFTKAFNRCLDLSYISL